VGTLAGVPSEGNFYECSAPAHEVLAFLLNEAKPKAKPVREKADSVVIKYGPSLSANSWGEKVEVSVRPYGPGSRIYFRSSARLATDLGADPDSAVVRAVFSIETRFGRIRFNP
jgi:hypothetical protein